MHTVLATQMCTLLYLPPFLLSLVLSSKSRKQKSVEDKEKTQKIKTFEQWPTFELFLGNQNGHPELDPHAYVLAEIGAVIRKS